MHSVQHTPLQNQLLAVLPIREFTRLSANLELAYLTLGQEIFAPGRLISKVYFPTTSIVTLMYELEDGSTAGIAAVGNEGILGISVYMGGETAPHLAVVQCAGWCYQLDASYIKAEFNRGGPVMLLLLRYTQALLTQMAQTGVCNRHHSIEQQLSRWLLRTLDRFESNSLTVTQELISSELGVRREGVANAASKLQNAGYIRYSRGKITVLDRTGIEKSTCECYFVVKREFDRLLRATPPTDLQQMQQRSVKT